MQIVQTKSHIVEKTLRDKEGRLIHEEITESQHRRDWTAAAWRRERKDHVHWGRKTQIVSPPEEKKKPNVKSVLEAVERVSKRMAERDKSSGSD